MNDESDITKAIMQANWRQGSVVQSSLLAKANFDDGEGPLLKATDNAWGIVITHDCDLLQRVLDKEPWVEFLLARPVDSRNSRCTGGRNPRKIQFEAVEGNQQVLLEASSHDRLRLRRRRLADNTPHPTRQIREGDLRIITRWLGKRYARPAFPSEFEKRLKPARKIIEQLLRRYKDHLEEIFVALNPDEELPKGQDYKCIAVILYSESWDDQDELDSMENDFRDAFEKCRGIQSLVKRRSEREFTYADQKELRRLDFDFLSDFEQDEDEALANCEAVAKDVSAERQPGWRRAIDRVRRLFFRQ